MAPDDARIADTRAWLRKAELDLLAATHNLSAPADALWGDVAFHAQQATEKALKALLALHDLPFRKTHSIEELGRQCVALDPTLGAVVDQAVPLTEFAWKFRYPGDTDEPTREEAEKVLGVARAVYGAVLVRVPSEARPAPPSSPPRPDSQKENSVKRSPALVQNLTPPIHLQPPSIRG